MNTITTRNHTTIAKHLANREAFKTHGALSGKATARGIRRGGYMPGRLPGDWARTLEARADVIDFVVYSYVTPIAWHDTEAGWIVPDERYSVTTSRHQSRVRVALAYNGETYAE